MKITDPIRIRVLTHNIRYATETPSKGEQKWEIRCSRLINELCFSVRHCMESIICLQEALHRQLLDIIRALNAEEDTWNYVGVGRDDGNEAGEFSPIIYRKDIWELKAHKTIWLSETPDVPSKSWDAASIRILTIANFQHHATRKTLIAMNTHLDDQGSESRMKSAQIILEQIHAIASQNTDGKSLPIFLAGDFNSEPDQEAYKKITKAESPMIDLMLSVPENKRYGDINTFTGFDTSETQRQRIDFIFINHKPSSEGDTLSGKNNPERHWQVEGFTVLPNRFEDEIYNSDHRAVIGDLLLT
ncbi:hypothetical protein ACLMJK_005035 [Lecanora helva]